MTSVTSPRQALRALEQAPPGERFQRLYRKRQQSTHGGVMNWVLLVIGLLVVAAGVVTYPIPVIPSDIIILVGIAIFAQGSARGARAFDWAEMRFRRRFPGVIRLWKRLPQAGKIGLTTGWVALATTIGFLIYRSLD